MALRIPFAALLAEEDSTIATYLQLLEERAEALENGG
jgi:hypothetical protein